MNNEHILMLMEFAFRMGFGNAMIRTGNAVPADFAAVSELAKEEFNTTHIDMAVGAIRETKQLVEAG